MKGTTGAGKHEGRAAVQHSKRPEPELNQEDAPADSRQQAVDTKDRRRVVSRRVAIARSKQQDREVVSGDEEHGATDTRGEAEQKA